MNSHVCTIRSLPLETMRPQRMIRTDGPRRAVAEYRKLWINGSNLKVQIRGGTREQRQNVIRQAQIWTQYANLSFDFTGGFDSPIRVAFDPDDGAWSYIGTDAQSVPRALPTMNLGFEDGGTAAHEFGHALGLGHEHQNPQGGVKWNEAFVLLELGQGPNFWTESEVRNNVLDRYAADHVRGTSFDRDSIMLYSFPAEWTLDGYATHANETLSNTDKAFIGSAQAYPRAKVRPWVEIGVGSLVHGRIGAPGEEDIFRFHVDRPGRYILSTRGRQDLMLKLFGVDDPTRLIAEDDDSGYGLNARIKADLGPGTYYAQVRHYATAAMGDYRLIVERA